MKLLAYALFFPVVMPLAARAADLVDGVPAARIEGPALTAWAGAIGKTLTVPGLDAVRQIMDRDLESGRVLKFLVLPMTGRSVLVDEKPQYARRLAQALASQGLTAEAYARLDPAKQVEALGLASWTALRDAQAERSRIAAGLSPLGNPSEGEVLALAGKAKELLGDDLPYLQDQYTLKILNYAVMRGEAVERDRKLRIEKFDKELPARIAAGEFDYGKLALVTDGVNWGLADKSAVPTTSWPRAVVLNRSNALAYVSVGPWSKAMHGALWHAVETEPAKSAIAGEAIRHSLLLNARLIDAHIDYEGNRQPKELQARKNVAAALKAGKLPKAADVISIEHQYLTAIDGAAKDRTLQLNILDWLRVGKSADYPAWSKILAAKQALLKRNERAKNWAWGSLLVTFFGGSLIHASSTVILAVTLSLLTISLGIVSLNGKGKALSNSALGQRMAAYDKELGLNEPK